MIDVLRRTGFIVYAVVPDGYQRWHPRYSAHDLIRRPGCVAVNRRGDIIVGDLEGNVLVMVTRHCPAIVKVVAGKWGPPGAASAIEGNATRVRLAYPWGLAMHATSNGKKEFCHSHAARRRKL